MIRFHSQAMSVQPIKKSLTLWMACLTRGIIARLKSKSIYTIKSDYIDIYSYDYKVNRFIF